MNIHFHTYVKGVLTLLMLFNTIVTFAIAPFGKCQTPILKNTPKKPTKKIGDWSPIEEPDEISLTEDTLLEAINNMSANIESEESLKQWVNLLSCVYNWIESSKNTHKKIYLESLEELYLISDSTNILANELSNPRYTDAQKDYHKATGINLVNKIISINNILLPILEKNSNNSSSWKKSVPVTSKLKSLYTSYGKLLDRFTNNYSPEDEEDYEKFFDTLTENLTIEDLSTNFNDIEKMIYRYDNSYFHSSREKEVINLIKNYQNYLLNRFSNGLYFYSSSYKDRFINSKDIAVKSLLVICQRIFYILNTVLKRNE